MLTQLQLFLKMSKSEHNLSIPFNPQNIEIQIDTSCDAVYVQFTRKAVAKTIDCSRDNETLTVDLDKTGEAVGVEAIGLQSISIKQIFNAIKPCVDGIELSQLDDAKISMLSPVAA